jgi:hypothetical protein
MATICSHLLKPIRRAVSIPSFLLVGHVNRLLALQLREFVYTVSLLVTLEPKSLLLVSSMLMRSKNFIDGVISIRRLLEENLPLPP